MKAKSKKVKSKTAKPVRDLAIKKLVAKKPAAKKRAIGFAQTRELLAAAPSPVAAALQAQIDAGRITFDPGPPFKDMLLGAAGPGGVSVTEKLQKLVLALSKLKTPPLKISSLVRVPKPGDSSSHPSGRAVDFGNEEIAAALLGIVANDATVGQLEIDEIIFDAGGASEADRNRWNYDVGKRHAYKDAVLRAHQNHIHFSVKA